MQIFLFQLRNLNEKSKSSTTAAIRRWIVGGAIGLVALQHSSSRALSAVPALVACP